MNKQTETNYVWKELAAVGRYGKMVRDKFISTADVGALTDWRKKHNNPNVFVSAATFPVPCRQIPYICPIYFVVRDNDLEQVRKSAPGVCYYLSENLSIPQDCIQINYDGDCEIVLLIPPAIFDGQATEVMSVINYHLCRQVIKGGVRNIDMDVYQRDHFFRLSNSINMKTSRYAVTLEFKELLYLDSSRITQLACKPRDEDSLIIPQKIPEVLKWFSEIRSQIENMKKMEAQLLKRMLETGWQVPPCVKRLQKLSLYDNVRLEAYRIMSQFYSWIKASPAQIWHQIQESDRRNPINDYQKMKAIVTFAIENPTFAECEHPLLQRFCAGDKCFMAGLKNEYEIPCLFEWA